MTGFIPELSHPNHVTTFETRTKKYLIKFQKWDDGEFLNSLTVTTRSGFLIHELQNADSKLVTKNGNQQAINTPITMPRVLNTHATKS